MRTAIAGFFVVNYQPIEFLPTSVCLVTIFGIIVTANYLPFFIYCSCVENAAQILRTKNVGVAPPISQFTLVTVCRVCKRLAGDSVRQRRG